MFAKDKQNGVLDDQYSAPTRVSRATCFQGRVQRSNTCCALAPLSRFHVFRSCTATELGALASRLQPVTFAEGATLIAQGDRVTPACMIFISEGRADVSGEPNGGSPAIEAARERTALGGGHP